MDDSKDRAKELSAAYDRAIQQGDLERAFELASKLALLHWRLNKESGRRWETDLALARAAVDAGELALDLGNLNAADGFFSDAERAFAFSRKAYRSNQAESQWESARNRLGRVALARGNAAEAFSVFLDVLERRKRRYSSEGNKNRARYSLAVSGTFVALASLKCGDEVSARGQSDEAIATLRRLVALFPKKQDFRLEMAWALVVQNAASAGTGDHLAKARQILEEIRDHCERDEKLWRVMKEAGMPVPGNEGGTLS